MRPWDRRKPGRLCEVSIKPPELEKSANYCIISVHITSVSIALAACDRNPTTATHPNMDLFSLCSK